MDAILSVFSARPAETQAAMSNIYKGLKKAQKKTEVWESFTLVCGVRHERVGEEQRGDCTSQDFSSHFQVLVSFEGLSMLVWVTAKSKAVERDCHCLLYEVFTFHDEVLSGQYQTCSSCML